MMNSTCTRCALRLQRAAQSDTQQLVRRAFSQTTTRRKGTLPNFPETANPELNACLAEIREKYFVPSHLNKREWRMITSPKTKQSLEDNPRTTEIYGEEIPLTWTGVGLKGEKRHVLVKRITDLIIQEGEWAILPDLMVGWNQSGLNQSKFVLKPKEMEKLIRKANLEGKIGVIVQCLQQAERTGLTLQRKEVVDGVVWGLREAAATEDWSEEGLAKALKNANQVALLMETAIHRAPADQVERGPRRRPDVIGVFLELEAVNAYKFQKGQDESGKVKAYADRLLSCMGDNSKTPSPTPAATGPQLEMLQNVPIWHGLRLAQKVLGPNMPQAELAQKIITDYEAALKVLAQAIEGLGSKEGSYNAQAVRVWNECIRD